MFTLVEFCKKSKRRIEEQKNIWESKSKNWRINYNYTSIQQQREVIFGFGKDFKLYGTLDIIHYALLFHYCGVQEERDQFGEYDKVHGVREKFRQALINEFGHLGLREAVHGFNAFQKMNTHSF